MHRGENSLFDTISGGNQEDSSKLQKIQIAAAGILYNLKPWEQMTPNIHELLSVCSMIV